MKSLILALAIISGSMLFAADEAAPTTPATPAKTECKCASGEKCTCEKGKCKCEKKKCCGEAKAAKKCCGEKKAAPVPAPAAE